MAIENLKRALRPAALALVAAAGLFAAPAQALSVFTCEPEWAALVRALAPDAQVVSATHERQDPHHIEARPALIGALRRADLAVCTGAGLEAGWLPLLLSRASHPEIRTARPELFYAASAVDLIDKAQPSAFSLDDVHAEGNPHLQLDPHRLRAVAAALAKRLAERDPAHATRYAENHRRWDQAWAARVQDWERRAASLRGRAVVAQHSTWAYLWRWLGMRQVADLEPRPGSAPTPAHLRDLLQRLRQQPALVVHALYQDPQPAQWLVAQLPALGRPLALASTVASEGQAATLEGWYEQLLQQLIEGANAAR